MSHTFNQPFAAALTPLHIPVAGCTVPAGFPSPAEDFSGERLDISKLLVAHPQATFFMYVAGPSMREYGIDDRDLIAVDRAIRPRHGHIVVAVIEGDFTVKKLYSAHGVVKLCAGNPTYPDIVPRGNQELQIWGVVTSCIKRYV